MKWLKGILTYLKKNQAPAPASNELSERERELQEAQSPMTPPERLAELSQRDEKNIQRALSQNPSTPLDPLFNLGAKYPKELFENPILPLLLLENPAYFAGVNGSLVLAWLRSSAAPEFLLVSAATHPSPRVRAAIADHPNTPVPLLQRLAEDRDSNIRYAVATNPKLPASIGERLALDQDTQVRRGLLRRPKLSTRAIALLATDKEGPIRQEALKHPAMPAELTELLQKMAVEPPDLSFSQEQLSYLSTLGAWGRLFAAKHPHSTSALLAPLAEDPWEEVRAAIAAHPNTANEQRERLAAENAYRVLRAIASSLHTPISLLERLARERRGLSYLAENPNTPAALLSRLAAIDLSQCGAGIMRNPNAPKDLRWKILRDHSAYSYSYRASAAESPYTEAKTLQWLALDWSPYVRSRAAKNPALPNDFLQLLYQAGATLDLSHKERPSALHLEERARLLRKKRWALLLLSDTEEGQAELQRAIKRAPSSEMRRELAKEKRLPEAIVELLVNDKDRFVRCAMIEHPSLTRAQMERLAKDRRQVVARTASQRLTKKAP